MSRTFRPTLILGAMMLLATPIAAKDGLGVFSNWAAFRDIEGPRCYAIAKAQPNDQLSEIERDFDPYASIGTWPNREIRNQLHFRLSREIAPGASITLRVGGRNFDLTGGGGDAWAQDQAMDAAIIARIRVAETMRVSSSDTRGQSFSDTYLLAGVATAMDAATLGCAPAALQQARGT